MICKKCGVESDGRFCPVCGSEMKRTCNYCGAELSENAAVCTECGAPTEEKKHCKNCGAVYTGAICMSCGVPESAFFSEEEKNAAQAAENKKKTERYTVAKGAIYFAALCVLFLGSFFVGVQMDNGTYFVLTAIIDLFYGPVDSSYAISIFFAVLGLGLIVTSFVFALKGGLAYFKGLKTKRYVSLGKSFCIVYFLFSITDLIYCSYFETLGFFYPAYVYAESSDASTLCGVIGMLALVVSLILNCRMKECSPFKKKGTLYGLVIAAYSLLYFLASVCSDLFSITALSSGFAEESSALAVSVACVLAFAVTAVMIATAVCWLQSYYGESPLKRTLLILSSALGILLVICCVLSVSFAEIGGVIVFFLGYFGVTVAYCIAKRKQERDGNRC